MHRRQCVAFVLFAFATLAGAARRAQAQAGAVVGVGLGVGYVALSTASMWRLFEGARAASGGDSVRMVVRDGTRTRDVRGRLGSIALDSINVEMDSGAEHLAIKDIPRMDVYRGLESKWAQGWAIGFGTGAAVGAVSGYSQGDDPPGCDFLCFTARDKAVILGVVGAVSGSSLGALVGAMARGAHWTPVGRLDESRIAISPVIGRTTGLTARITF